MGVWGVCYSRIISSKLRGTAFDLFILGRFFLGPKLEFVFKSSDQGVEFNEVVLILFMLWVERLLVYACLSHAVVWFIFSILSDQFVVESIWEFKSAGAFNSRKKETIMKGLQRIYGWSG